MSSFTLISQLLSSPIVPFNDKVSAKSATNQALITVTSELVTYVYEQGDNGRIHAVGMINNSNHRFTCFGSRIRNVPCMEIINKTSRNKNIKNG